MTDAHGGPVRKQRADAPEGFYRAEAAGLRWLAAARTAGGADVAEVLDVGDTFIALARVAAAAPTAAAAERFGRALRHTHRAGAGAFGAPPDGYGGPCYIGRQRLPTGEYDRWGACYADLRLRPYADEARRVGTLGADGYAAVRAVCDRLTAGEFDDDTPPARIHGDLWAGNVLYSAAGVVLIDPAAHGGHAETDLAMLALFGVPGLERIRDAYAEAAGWDTSWRDRVGLHQLHPLLVHAVTHGASYGRQAGLVARQYK